mmetsp:Transcript_175208/g.561912  ORF Transcript_175208/g.561912 Transcript_175208/m.561912 type:complete len:127 (+) Transcript_175208:113-493(+)
MWIGVAMLRPNHLIGSSMSALYFGQQEAIRRGELAGLSNLAEKVGGLVALGVASPVTVAWLRAHEEGASGSSPAPPAVQAVFEVLSALSFYVGWLRYDKQDNYSNTFWKVSSESRSVDHPKPASDQ